MSNISKSPLEAITLTDWQVTVPLSVSGTSDHWRKVYNSLASSQEPPIPATASGINDKSTVIVRVTRSDGPEALVETVGRAANLLAIADQAANKWSDDEYRLRGALSSWWEREWVPNHPGSAGR